MCVASLEHALFKRFTHKPLRHRASYIHDQLEVSFDIKVEWINSLRGVKVPFEHHVLPDLALVHSYLTYSTENDLGI